MAVTPLIAIVGRPNVGKSSLFNRLIGARQAITHEVAGTTRNANQGGVIWRGYHFGLIDTAGLARADDQIEMAAQDQIREIAATASVIVVVVDATTMITEEDQDAARLALKTGKPVILVLGKADAAGQLVEDEYRRLGIQTIIAVSAIHGRGTGDLLDEIVKLIDQIPEPPVDDIVRLALIGRPNVGKSSILNAIMGKQQAIVSDVAGTTRDTSVGRVKSHERTIEILDTAGIRRRGKIVPGVEKFSSLRTMTAIYESDVCLLILDANDGVVAGDLNLAGAVLEAGKGLIIVMNKWDAVEKDDKTQSRLTGKLQSQFQFAWWAPLVYTSAITGLHINKLLELTLEIDGRRRQQIATGPFNRLLEKAVVRQAPAGLKGKQPKINYGTQTGTNPPTFTIFCTYPDLVHFSYRRYLENQLREAHDFTGTPVVLEFKHKHGDNLRRKPR